MKSQYAVGVGQYQRMTTHELREAFLLENLFNPGTVDLVYWETDRTAIGSATPLALPLKLESNQQLAADYFCERRELGVLNIGGPGKIRVDGTDYAVGMLDCL